MTTLRVVRGEPQSLAGVVAKRIRVFLAEYGIKQVAVAEAMGMSKAAFSKRVAGKQTMDLDEIELLAETLGVQPGVFLSGETPRLDDPTGGGMEPPRGIEPLTYSLRGNRNRAKHAPTHTDPVIPMRRAS